MTEPEAAREFPPGRVFWITGLSGAGKTTVGLDLRGRLRAAGRSAIFLDGDALRVRSRRSWPQRRQPVAIGDAQFASVPAAGETGDRRGLCHHLAVSRVQRWNRENIRDYREIYLRVPMEELQRRDSKGSTRRLGAVRRGTSWASVCQRVSGEPRSGPRQLWRARRYHRGRLHPGNMRRTRR